MCTNLLQTWECAYDDSFVKFKSGTSIILFILKKKLLGKENTFSISKSSDYKPKHVFWSGICIHVYGLKKTNKHILHNKTQELEQDMMVFPPATGS